MAFIHFVHLVHFVLGFMEVLDWEFIFRIEYFYAVSTTTSKRCCSSKIVECWNVEKLYLGGIVYN